MDELQALYDELKKKDEKLKHFEYYEDGAEVRKEISVLRSRIKMG